MDELCNDGEPQSNINPGKTYSDIVDLDVSDEEDLHKRATESSVSDPSSSNDTTSETPRRSIDRRCKDRSINYRTWVNECYAW